MAPTTAALSSKRKRSTAEIDIPNAKKTNNNNECAEEPEIPSDNPSDDYGEPSGSDPEDDDDDDEREEEEEEEE